MYIFIFRQFFINLPKELEEAAYIDGCGFIQTHFRIILPISKSSILVVSILSMVFHWNDYTEPNMYLTNPKIRIFPQGLPGLYRMAVQMVDDLGYVIDKSIYNQATASAGAVLSLLPILVVYLVAQNNSLKVFSIPVQNSKVIRKRKQESFIRLLFMCMPYIFLLIITTRTCTV